MQTNATNGETIFFDFLAKVPATKIINSTDLHFWVASTESLTIPMAGLSAFRRNGEVMLNSTRRCYPSALALVTLALSSPPREEATDAKIRPGNPAPAIGPGINR